MFAKVLHADGVKVPLTADFRHDLPRMAEACDASTGLVYVCNPNNPTGTIVSGDEMAAFAARVPASATILVDEAYHHFVEDPRYRSSCELIAARPNVVVARTFSKIYGMAGLRLGYAIGAEPRIQAMAPFASWSNTNSAVLAAALECLADPELVPRQKKTLNDTRRWLVAELSKQGRRTMPSETNFVMIDVGGDVTPVIEAFRSAEDPRRAKISVAPELAAGQRRNAASDGGVRLGARRDRSGEGRRRLTLRRTAHFSPSTRKRSDRMRW